MRMTIYQIVTGHFKNCMLIDHSEKLWNDYVYLGLRNSFRRILCENQVIIPVQKINLIVNFDCVLLYKSTSVQFWSIL